MIDDPDEKAKALLGVVDRFFPGRAAELRQTHAQESKATTVIGMRIEEASAKVRAAGVGDDEEDYGHPVWAGVFPVQTVIGASEACPRLLPGMAKGAGLAGYLAGRRLDEALLEAQELYESETEMAQLVG